jgi:2-polyprenyl-3-methyl-5-hydroxy-6-metoxy-1,4-benzoquinol methylase
MTYKERLDAFNSSEKYKKEVGFLMKFIHDYSELVLDYGCGTGACAEDVYWGIFGEVHGFDTRQHNPNFKYKEVLNQYDVIYLMHSLAHLESPLKTLKMLQKHLHKFGQIIIITPNKDWIDKLPESEDYKPDETVVQHFCQYKLEQLVKDAGMKIEHQGQFGARLGEVNERLFLIATL